jgi:hypothetical protein
MSQLVGVQCLRCRETISSITEGRFCTTCGTPHHDYCQNPDPTANTEGRCPTCGCDLRNEFAVRFRGEQCRQQEQPIRRTTSRIFWAVVLLQLIALGTAVVAVLVAWPFVKQGEDAAGYAFGGVLLLSVVLVEVVAYGLHRRKKWAWTAGVAVFVVSLPSVAAVLGILLLLDRRVRAEFEQVHSVAEASGAAP